MVRPVRRLLAILVVPIICSTVGGTAGAVDAYAYCHNDQGSDGNLVDACTMAIETQRLNQAQWIQAHINRATHLIRLNRYPEAIRDLDVVTDLRPNDVQPFATRARLYHSLGRLQEAHHEYLECAKRTRDPGCKEEADVIGKALYPEKSEWDLHMSSIVWNYVDVNGRQVFGKEDGSAKISLNRYFKTGYNEIIVRRKHIGAAPGLRLEIRKDGRRMLLVPPAETVMGFQVRYTNLMKIVIHRESGQCWIHRGYGLVAGMIYPSDNRGIDVSGPEPCEHYRYVPSKLEIEGGGPPMMPGSSPIKYLQKLYKFHAKQEKQKGR